MKLDDSIKVKLRTDNKVVHKLVYSRLLIIGILVLIQMAFYVYLCFKINTNTTKYFLGGNIALSVGFIVYLVNSSGKNEFKLVWMLPVLIFPLFGIVLYFISHRNIGNYALSKRIRKVKSQSQKFMENLPEEEKALESYPKISDISYYIKKGEGFPAYSENRTKYYASGEAMLPDMIKELKSAKEFIFMDYFIVGIGSFWDQILEALKEKASQGVKVRILYDGFGSLSLSTKSYLDYLKSMGIEARVFMPLVPFFDTALNSRDHHKILVVDGRICFTGGINLTDEYVNLQNDRFDYWKDTAISIEGSGVRSFTRMFLEMWYSQQKKCPEYEKECETYLNREYATYENKGAIIPYSDDVYNDIDLAENVYNYIISKSHHYVHIMSPYLIVDNTLVNALIFAAQRGIEVSIIVPGHYDHFVTYCVGHRFAKLLIQNGIHIYAYMPGFIHAKVFVSDDNRGTVGSINLDYRSLYHHFECGTYLYKTDSILDLEKDFEATKAQCEEITMEKYKTLSKFRRFVGWIFKIFAPIL